MPLPPVPRVRCSPSRSLSSPIPACTPSASPMPTSGRYARYAYAGRAAALTCTVATLNELLVCTAASHSHAPCHDLCHAPHHAGGRCHPRGGHLLSPSLTLSHPLSRHLANAPRRVSDPPPPPASAVTSGHHQPKEEGAREQVSPRQGGRGAAPAATRPRHDPHDPVGAPVGVRAAHQLAGRRAARGGRARVRPRR